MPLVKFCISFVSIGLLCNKMYVINLFSSQHLRKNQKCTGGEQSWKYKKFKLNYFFTCIWFRKNLKGNYWKRLEIINNQRLENVRVNIPIKRWKLYYPIQQKHKSYHVTCGLGNATNRHFCLDPFFRLVHLIICIVCWI